MIPSELTDRQREVLDFIVERTRAGRAPTVREICQHFGFTSLNGAACHLHALEKKGYVAPIKRCARSIQVLDTGRAETLWGSFPV